MAFFEDVKLMVEGAGWSPRKAIAHECYTSFQVLALEQRPPWTYVKMGVRFNGVLFEGVGFARQRQYTSLVAYRVKGFPWFRVVLARKDKWDADVGQAIAGTRALRNIIDNALRVYRRWERGQVQF